MESQSMSCSGPCTCMCVCCAVAVCLTCLGLRCCGLLSSVQRTLSLENREIVYKFNVSSNRDRTWGSQHTSELFSSPLKSSDQIRVGMESSGFPCCHIVLLCQVLVHILEGLSLLGSIDFIGTHPELLN